MNTRKLASSRAWKAANRARNIETMKRWRAANSEHVKGYNAAARARLSPARKAEYNAKYRSKNIAKIRQYSATHRSRKNALARERYANDETYRLEKRIRASLSQALRRVKSSKETTLTDTIGCTVAQLRAHLEAQFQPGMTWGAIHVDHARPCASFDLTEQEQIRSCFNYTNLSPMWKHENLRKGALWGGKRWRSNTHKRSNPCES